MAYAFKQLHGLRIENGVIFDCTKSLEERDLPNKVLTLGWNISNDTLHFDARDVTKFVAKIFALQVSVRIFDPIGFVRSFADEIKCLMQEI